MPGVLKMRVKRELAQSVVALDSGRDWCYLRRHRGGGPPSESLLFIDPRYRVL